ncbi:MAG TPA: M20/M25/M40 family metallo-hydrolase [Planctomycetaceae bacterium]|nr:M20/M25/M40 family metallo-hydrolase [Planctomycetaceae bacterium]
MDVTELAAELIAVRSVSAESNVAVSDVVERVLRGDDFETERLEYDDANSVRKACIVGRKGPSTTGGLAFFCHTDVVPAETWNGPNGGPFSPGVHHGRLYGRGSCDMKGPLAAAITAANRFSSNELKAPIYVIATADEEVGSRGAAEVAERSALFQQLVQSDARGVITEPTELQVVYAHKGVYCLQITSRGRAAHSSTRLGVNANLAMIPFLAEMKQIHDETLTDPKWLNEEFDPPWISWNIGINDHTPAVNITAPHSVCTIAFRPMPGQKPDELVERVRQAALRCGLEFEARVTAGPLYTDPQSPYVRETLTLVGGTEAKTVAYGTDGVMLSAVQNLIVLGPGSIQQAHTDDEFIALDALQAGVELYTRMVRHWCCR